MLCSVRESDDDNGGLQMGLTIQQVAEITGISTDALRYYDKEGIVSPKRLINGYRLYDEADITSLKNLIVMKYARFTLAEIKQMEELVSQAPSADCNEISRGILTSKTVELRQAISNYQKIVAWIEDVLLISDGTISYQDNKEQLDVFLDEIYEEIQRERSLPGVPPSLTGRQDQPQRHNHSETKET